MKPVCTEYSVQSDQICPKVYILLLLLVPLFLLNDLNNFNSDLSDMPLFNNVTVANRTKLSSDTTDCLSPVQRSPSL